MKSSQPMRATRYAKAGAVLPEDRPFPGMDPFIEMSGRWDSFRPHMSSRIMAVLNKTLPKGYRAFMEDQSTTVGAKGDPPGRTIRADVGVERHLGDMRSPASTIGGHEPVMVVELDEPVRVYPVVVKRGADIVTWIEVMSPSNKEGGGRGDHIEKRDELLARGVNYVEIDLLRDGERSVTCPDDDDFLIYTVRGRSHQAALWPVSMADVLPCVRLPLAPGESDAWLDVQAAMESCYAEASYATAEEYRKPLSPPPSDELIAWVEGRVDPHR